ncbi:hypothetical protein [Caballeronia sp. ATUFL_M1_KS5A]|uniref:hypothetical protein n=1 Tax=Caballeronia sp. ATUFL_M1_KS5A TaxID=2921778 RepID=UPI0020278ED7|nr:hypothetical protein [Caballeronia sp. ATUFL_M1_KS5A]
MNKIMAFAGTLFTAACFAMDAGNTLPMPVKPGSSSYQLNLGPIESRACSRIWYGKDAGGKPGVSYGRSYDTDNSSPLLAYIESTPVTNEGDGNIVTKCAIEARKQLGDDWIAEDLINASVNFRKILQTCVSSERAALRIFSVKLQIMGPCGG